MSQRNSSSCNKEVRVWSSSKQVKPQQELMLIFQSPIDEKAQVTVLTPDAVIYEARRHGALNYKFVLGSIKAGEHKLEVHVNDKLYATAAIHVADHLLTLEEAKRLMHDILNPLELLCQVLRIESSNREDLDRELADLMPHRSVLDLLCSDRSQNSVYEIPTLVHFAAKYGLTCFCMELLRLPEGKLAAEIENKDGMLPHEIAEEANFNELADNIKLSTGRRPVSRTSKISLDSGISTSVSESSNPRISLVENLTNVPTTEYTAEKDNKSPGVRL